MEIYFRNKLKIIDKDIFRNPLTIFVNEVK